MKIAVLSDIHFGVRNNNPVYLDHFLKFFDEIFIPECQKRSVKWCAIAGDVFDHRKMTNIDILRTVNKCFWPKMIEQFSGGINIIPGNHDIYHTNTLRVNALEEHVPKAENIHLHMIPTKWTYEGLNVLFIPWICEENQEDCIKALAENAGTHWSNNHYKVSHVIGHFHLNGFNMGNGQVAEGGMNEGLFVGSYKSVASGHFHTLSKVYRHYYRQGEHRGTTIQYLGAPYEMMWGDWNDPKGFHFLDSDTGEYQFIRNPNRLHHKVVYDDTVQNEECFQTAYTLCEKAYVRLIIANKTDAVKFDQFLDNLEKVAYDVKIIDQTVVSMEPDISKVGANIYGDPITMSEDDIWVFVKQAIDDLKSTENKTKLEGFMNELYKEAQLKQS